VTQWLVPIDAIAKKRGADDPREIGGKAARLTWLVRHGFAVPEAWVIPAEVFATALRELPPGCDPRSLLRAASGSAGMARAAEARDEILKGPLPKGVSDALGSLWERVADSAPWGLAVRSSATCEDGELVSMAGLADSKLGVRGKDALADAVRAVWASLASGRALAYLAAHGVKDVGMAVVVQRMVEARAAGVMFTRAPDARGRHQRVINAGFGLGAPVVDGVTTPDVFRIDDRGRVVESLIAHKERATVVTTTGLAEVLATAPDAPSLANHEVLELAEVALRLERLDRAPWDVEFACDPEKTWLVQARPITGRGFPEGGDEDTVWSTVNVGEALPGVATPLTWSVAGAFSEAGFRRAFGALGCSVPRHAHLVGNVHGRFYLNLTEFMRIAAQVPWLKPHTLVDLGGGAGGDELEGQITGVSRKGFYARMPFTALRLAREHLRLDEDVAHYEEEASAAQRAHGTLDLAILPDDGLARTLRDLQGLLERSGTVMLTCAASALGAHLALKAVLTRVAPLGSDRLVQALTSGIRDLESARPAIGILRVAGIARTEPAARAVLEDARTTGVDDLPDGATRRALQSFLDLYGDRTVREAELSTPRWREDPRPVLTMLRVALRGEAREVEPALAKARSQADTEMAGLLPRLNLAEQTLVRHLVARAQKAARLRERMRTWVTRVLGMLRDAVLDADRRLIRLSPELAPPASGGGATLGSAFFLTFDEIIVALRTSRATLGPLVRARRAEFARDCARPDPPATFVGTPPSVVLPPLGGDVLRGLPASPGVVEGRARVILSVDGIGELETGEVLVVRTTDVGWTPLFLLAAGVVTELGGPLSHAAVVAREFGVPSVVNVDGATRAIKTGDLLRVDGGTGVVERVKG
jgi:phosphohistidine swiveling domain-containing protein